MIIKAVKIRNALVIELTRHNHPMAGKRYANERLAGRAINQGYVYKVLPSTPDEKHGSDGHPGYACISKFPERSWL